MCANAKERNNDNERLAGLHVPRKRFFFFFFADSKRKEKAFSPLKAVLSAYVSKQKEPLEKNQKEELQF